MPIFSPEELIRHLDKVPVIQGPAVAGEQIGAQPDDPNRLKRWIALLGGQMFDAGSTTFALNQGATESNPIMRPFADKPAAFYPIKIGIGALTALLLDRVAKKEPEIANGAAIGSTIGLGIAGTRNLVNGFEHKRINNRDK
ncbi:MAG: DUF5658 family protein [Candidatus Altimarinota bacterium]